MRQVVFVGNCQAVLLCKTYATAIAPFRSEKVSLVETFNKMTDEDRAKIDQADVIVNMIFDSQQETELPEINPGVEIINFPMITAGFLWPFSGADHVKNRAIPYFGVGPYHKLLGDRWLDKRILDGTEPSEAVKQYMCMDIAKEAKLSRLYELVMDRQRSRDLKCGIYCADEIENSFKIKPIFLNQYHPNTHMASFVARAVYRKLGAEESTIDRVLARWVTTYHAKYTSTAVPFSQPIHPGVAQFYGLQYGDANYKYSYHTGEMQTFEEHAKQYMLYSWNEPLLKGIETYHAGGLSAVAANETINDLDTGLSLSTGSAFAEDAMAMLLAQRGQIDEGLTRLDRALALDPDNGLYYEHQCTLLELQGRFDEALASIACAIAAEPANGHFEAHRASLLLKTGQLEKSEQSSREAVRLHPEVASLHHKLAQVLGQQEKWNEASLALTHAVELEPNHINYQSDLAITLIRAGEFAKLARAIEDAAAVNSNFFSTIHYNISLVFFQINMLAHAVESARKSFKSDETNISYIIRLAFLLQERGDLAESESYYRVAVELKPEDSGIRSELVKVLERQGKHIDAQEARQRATEYSSN